MRQLHRLVIVLAICLVLVACHNPSPQPTFSPISPLPAAAKPCAPEWDKAWRIWRIAQQPAAVYALTISQDNKLWAGTSFGVWQVDPATGEYTSHEETGSTDVLLPVQDKGLWAAGSGGVVYFDEQTESKFSLVGDIRNYPDFITGMGVDYNGDLHIVALLSRSSVSFHYPGYAPPASGDWKPIKDSTLNLDWYENRCQNWESLAFRSYVHRSQAECEALGQARQALRLAPTSPAKIALGADGSIWQVADTALTHVSGDWSSALQLHEMQVYAIAPDPIHGIWLGTNKGLAYSDGRTLRWVSLGLEVCNVPGYVQDIAIDDQGNAWAALSYGRIQTLSPGQISWRPANEIGLAEGVVAKPIQAVTTIPGDGVWGTHGWDLWHFDGENTSEITLADRRYWIEALAGSRNSVVAASRINSVTLEFIPAKEQWIKHANVAHCTSLAASADNTIYALCPNGLWSYSEGVEVSTEWHLVAPMPSETDQWEVVFAGDSQGGLWVGSRATGELSYYHAEQTVVSEQRFKQLAALHVDRQDRLWVASEDMLSVYDGKTWQHIPMPTRGVRKLASGPDGQIWLFSATAIAAYNPAIGMQP